MAEKPILFNTEMVQAIQAGLKTQTRRICKITSDSDPEPYNHSFCADVEFPATNYKGPCANFVDKSGHYIGAAKQHIQVGDVLWVRETWQRLSDFGEQRYVYCADYKDNEPLRLDGMYTRWRPSIHMPREAARIFLKVKGVLAERLQGITEQEAIAEGITRLFDYLTDEEFEKQIAPYSDFKKKSDFGWTNYLYKKDANHLYSDYQSPIDSFASLWNSTIKKADLPRYGWDANPWVWVIEFERCEHSKEG